MLIKHHLVNQEKDEAEYFLLSSLQPQVNKSAITFSDWNLDKHSIDCLCKRIALE